MMDLSAIRGRINGANGLPLLAAVLVSGAGLVVVAVICGIWAGPAEDALVELKQREFENWSEAGDHMIYAGPNIAFRAKSVSTVLAGLWQATDVAGEPDFQLRVIGAIDF